MFLSDLAPANPLQLTHPKVSKSCQGNVRHRIEAYPHLLMERIKAIEAYKAYNDYSFPPASYPEQLVITNTVSLKNVITFYIDLRGMSGNV